MRLLDQVLVRQQRSKPWIFGIGLSRTGTTSLCQALEIIGYKAVHLPPINSFKGYPTIDLAWPWWMRKFDAAADISVSAVFHQLAEYFPNAKFIYTRRNMDSWLASCAKHTTIELANRRVDQSNFDVLRLSRTFYGDIVFNEPLYRRAYLDHDQKVHKLMEKRKVLKVDFIENPRWDELCGFLEKDVPQAKFPHKNANHRSP